MLNALISNKDLISDAESKIRFYQAAGNGNMYNFSIGSISLAEYDAKKLSLDAKVAAFQAKIDALKGTALC